MFDDDLFILRSKDESSPLAVVLIPSESVNTPKIIARNMNILFSDIKFRKDSFKYKGKTLLQEECYVVSEFENYDEKDASNDNIFMVLKTIGEKYQVIHNDVIRHPDASADSTIRAISSYLNKF